MKLKEVLDLEVGELIRTEYSHINNQLVRIIAVDSHSEQVWGLTVENGKRPSLQRIRFRDLCEEYWAAGESSEKELRANLENAEAFFKRYYS